MSFPGTNSRSRVVREMAEQARKLAMQGRWLEAIAVNSQLTERSPRDVDALNRLGKAHFELQQYRSAYEMYSAALEADPASIIARRNIERLESLRDTEATDVENPLIQPPARYGAFVEEAGKTYVDDLIDPAPSAHLRTLSAGEKLEIQRDGQSISFVDSEGEYVGRPEPRLGRRLAWLLDAGNEYEIFVTANAGDRVRVIVREIFHHPDGGVAMSFPHQDNASIPRAYIRDSRLFRADEHDLLIPLDDDEDLDDLDLEDELEEDDDDDVSELVDSSMLDDDEEDDGELDDAEDDS